jgi:hypothetical protein
MSPNPAPAPPNLPPRLPGAEPVPEANAEWVTEARDMHALHNVAERIRKNQESHNWLEANKDNLLNTHPTTYHVGHGKAMAADMEIQKELDELCSRGDTTTLLDELSYYISSAKGEYSEAQKRAIQADTESMGKSQDESVAFSLMRHQQLRGGNGTPTFDTANSLAVKTYFAASTAARAHEKATNYVQGMEDLPGAFERVQARQAAKQEMTALQAEMLITDATDKLDRWPIDSNVPGDETEVRDLLRDLDTTLNDFSPVDSLRAKAQGNYVRLRYRLEQRLINASRLGNSHNTTATMEPDGGILLDNDTIIYGDGTTARSEHGVHVRRYPIGTVSPRYPETRLDTTPPPNPLVENGRRVTARQAVFDWERTRNTQTEVRAYSALNFEIAEGNATDAQQSQTLVALDARIKAAPVAVQEVHARAARENRLISQQDLDEINDINLQQQRDEAQVRRVAADRRMLRDEQNKLKYFKHLIEVGNRPVVPRAVATRRILRQTVEMHDDLAPAPIMRPDGRIEVQTTVDNHNDSLWTLLPDGRHIWRGTPVQYRAADGTPTRPF